jgi:hypothetical protein
MLLLMAKPSDDHFTEEETIARREAMLKRMLSTPPQHRTAKGEKANPPKKRGRPKRQNIVCRTIQEAVNAAATDDGRRAHVIYVSC